MPTVVRFPPDDPLAPLARDIARALTEPGFALHHCAQSHPLYRLGAAAWCPSPVVTTRAAAGGVVVSWTPHDLLSLDWDRWREYQGAREVMNGALAQVLDAFGFDVWPFGLRGAWIVTGRRPRWQEARR